VSEPDAARETFTTAGIWGHGFSRIHVGDTSYRRATGNFNAFEKCQPSGGSFTTASNRGVGVGRGGVAPLSFLQKAP
ncbi:MAG: hypothetical protein ACPLW8_05265, partial [Candidatus Bathyarchaeales archaeon]